MYLYAIDGVVPAEVLKRFAEDLFRNPRHPGELLATTCENKSLEISEAAELIGVSSADLARVIEGGASITHELAVQLEAAGWPSAEVWMSLQSKYDLAQARRAGRAAA